MEDILSLLENCQPNIVVQVSGRDLLEFTDALVQRACESRESLREIQEGEVYLSKKEVKDLLGVCDTTLWHWDRNHYHYHYLVINGEKNKSRGRASFKDILPWAETVLCTIGEYHAHFLRRTVSDEKDIR